MQYVPIQKLNKWQAAEPGRNWQVASWGGDGVRVWINWRFGESQLGGADVVVPSDQLQNAPFDALSRAVDSVLSDFYAWQRAYDASRQTRPPEQTGETTQEGD